MISLFFLFLCSLIYVIQFDLCFMMIIKMKDIINYAVILKWKHLFCTKYNNNVAIVEYYTIDRYVFDIFYYICQI